jgi:hypothetical protein
VSGRRRAAMRILISDQTSSGTTPAAGEVSAASAISTLEPQRERLARAGVVEALCEFRGGLTPRGRNTRHLSHRSRET